MRINNTSNIRLKNIINNISILKSGSLRNYQICSYDELLYIQKYCSYYNIIIKIVFIPYNYEKYKNNRWSILYNPHYVMSNISNSNIDIKIKEKCKLYIQLIIVNNINMMNYYEYNDYIHNIQYNPIHHIIHDIIFRHKKVNKLVIHKKIYGTLSEQQINNIKLYCIKYNIFPLYDKYLTLLLYKCDDKCNMFYNYYNDIDIKYYSNINDSNIDINNDNNINDSNIDINNDNNINDSNIDINNDNNINDID